MVIENGESLGRGHQFYPWRQQNASMFSLFWGSTPEKAFLFPAGMGRTPLMFHRPNHDPIAVHIGPKAGAAS